MSDDLIERLIVDRVANEIRSRGILGAGELAERIDALYADEIERLRAEIAEMRRPMSGYDLKFLGSIADEMIDQGYPTHGDHVHDAADEIGYWVEDYLEQEGWAHMAVQYVPRPEGYDR